MPLPLDSLEDIVNRFRADVTNALPDLDPTIIGSFIRGLMDGFSARIFESNLTIEQVAQQSFLQTATGIYLEYHAARDGLRRNPATPAIGYIMVTGASGISVPRETILSAEDGSILKTTAAVTTQQILTTIDRITRIGITATVECRTPHNLASGVYGEVSGADPSGYNGLVLVTVIDESIFTYQVEEGLATPAIGDMSVFFTGAVLPVETEGTGQAQNIGAGAGVSLVSPPAGIEVSAFVGPLGIEGGTEIEEDEALRARAQEKSSAMLSMFNVAAISVQAKMVSGVTRVFVKEAFPEAGIVTIYFMRDNDLVPIPSSIDIQKVKDMVQMIRPATTEILDVIVLAPTPVVVDIIITDIIPNTERMKADITASLEDYFRVFVNFEQDISIDRIKAAIFRAQDVDTGEFLQEFTLVNPASNIVIVAGRIATLRSVTIT